MSHLDEGTLHALLDGELDAKEVREIQAHLGSCSACGTRLQSVKEVAAESDRLVGAIQFPGTPRRPAALDPAPALSRELPPEPAEPAGHAHGFEAPDAFEPPVAYEPPSPRAPRAPGQRMGGEPIYDESPPVLLVPDDNQWGERRRRVLVASRWAALVFVAVGAGYIASETRRTPVVPSVSAPALTDEPAPVMSAAEESPRPDTGPAPTRRVAPAAAESQPAPPARRPAPAPRPTEKATAPLGGRDEVLAGSEATAEPDADTAADDVEEERAQVRQASTDEPVPSPSVREEAAEAMARLDRERRRERAAAATAALDNEARRQAAAARNAPAPAAPAPTPPAPRTLEQRSNIYLRIGLDEAARQLGRPVHVIEGMQQQFMGLAQGVASPAADATRPVVRVVYQDNQGRMILLDQQRIRPGQTWSATETRWVVGEIGLALLGEPGPEILRNLRPRVR